MIHLVSWQTDLTDFLLADLSFISVLYIHAQDFAACFLAPISAPLSICISRILAHRFIILLPSKDISSLQLWVRSSGHKWRTTTVTFHTWNSMRYILGCHILISLNVLFLYLVCYLLYNRCTADFLGQVAHHCLLPFCSVQPQYGKQ